MFIKKRGKAKQEKDKANRAAAGGGAGDAADGAGDGAARSVMTNEDDFDHRLGNYQLMEAIGKGGYGTVYRGLNIERGMTVAVKRVNLQGIPHEELESIEMEIRLLQNLDHPNIVKYLDSIRSDDYLNIILEFVENGSLSSLLGKFQGFFPEQLCAHYITQVLKGLQYLHMQGVIHRDIKGANILSTKEGQVKLADFGVATKLNESRKSDSVVGTPYWMAPEIIEMTGQQSSACDIWSVGCTCVELLTGKPPYFDLQQMPALFRIVQDEHPPLPDNISPALEDFLLQTWQKDPNRRIDANGLLKHPWLKKSVEIFEVEELKRKMLQNEAAMAKLSLASVSAASSPTPPAKKPAAKHDSEEEDWDGEDEPAARSKLKLPGAPAAAAGAKPKKHVKMQPSAHASDNEDDWDEPEDSDHLAVAAAPGSGGKKPGHRSALSTAAFPVDNKKRAAQVKAANAKHSAAADDEPTDLVIKLRAPTEEEGDPFADFSGDDDEGAGMDTPDEDAETVVSKTSMKTIKSTVVAAPAQQQPQTTKAAATAPTANASFSLGGTSVGPVGTAPVARKLEAFVENDEEEMEGFEDLVDDDGDLELKAAAVAPGASGSAPGHHHSGSTLSLPAAAGHKGAKTSDAADADDKEDEADPFDDITFEDGEDKADDVLLNRSFLRVLEVLSPDSSERAVLDACEKLHEMGKTSPEQVRNLMTSHGVIPIMEMLEVSNAAILHAILKVVNNIVGKSQKFQQSMSLVGLILAIIRFGGPSYPREIRMEAANFVRQFCYASDWTRKMFIACDGLPVLVSFLSMEEYSMSKTLVWNAIDCIRHVFDITTNPKNDFCRLFCKFGLLEPLTRILQEVQADHESEDAPAFVLKIAGILHMFSQGDKVVKLHFARPSVIESMLRVLPSVPQEPLILLLKSIRNISMDSTTLDLLEAAGAIPALIPFLEPSAVSENQHQVLLTMYYLCQIKGSRQEQAALSGIIPHLQRFIREEHSLKQFAYPIIFLLAKTSWRTRQELKKYQGLQFYVDILTSPDVYWRSAALDCIAAWMSASVEDTARVSFLLNTSSNINKLLRVFRDTDDATQFDKMLPSFRKILATSIKVNQSLGRTPDFTREIRDRLCRHAASNNIRINLLKMVSLLFAAHPSPATLAAEADLTPVLHALLEDKSAVIVGSLTQKLLTQYLGDTKPADADTPNA